MEITIKSDPVENKLELFGPGDLYLRLLRDELEISIAARGDDIVVSGDEDKVEIAVKALDKMKHHLVSFGSLSAENVKACITGQTKGIKFDSRHVLQVYAQKKVIEPSTAGQLDYIDQMLNNDVSFCIGPAGTGKTYLAVAMAVSMLKKKQIRRIVLARPAVEAGERLGFLPGDLQAKVNPYLRPLFDALEDMMDFSQMRKFMDLDIIEVIPLAFMRGRTLNESVIICDEAQNTSPLQMLMVLTRLGLGSKMIITGDITQVDLEKNAKSGLVEAIERLAHLDGIGYVELARTDIVRHKLVQKIVRAYGKKLEK